MHLQQPAVLAWAQTVLNANGHVIQHPPKIIHDGPWSIVYRIATNAGTVYLKQMTPAFAIEATLTLFLKALFPASILEIIDHNENLHCFLMRDAGTPLRDSLKTHYDTHRACEALQVYAEIQQTTANHLDELFALGVPDWRLSTLPSLFLQLLDQKQFLEDDGLTLTDIAKLENLHPKTTELCLQLSQYNIPETIEHGDFHDNNILEHNGCMIIHDWGESIITHPFFSLDSFLFSAERQHGIDETSATYDTLLTSYLDIWSNFESKDNLRDAFKLAKRLHRIKYALSYYRIAQCPGWKESGQHKGRITIALQAFLQSGVNSI